MENREVRLRVGDGPSARLKITPIEYASTDDGIELRLKITGVEERKTRILEAIQMDRKNLDDIFKLECVLGIAKKGKDIVAQVRVFENEPVLKLALPTDWLCRSEKGWFVLTDEEYKKAKG